MDYPKVVYVEAVLMANGEVISYGKSLGWATKRQIELVENGACKLTKGKDAVIGINGQVA